MCGGEWVMHQRGAWRMVVNRLARELNHSDGRRWWRGAAGEGEGDGGRKEVQVVVLVGGDG